MSKKISIIIFQAKPLDTNPVMTWGLFSIKPLLVTSQTLSRGLDPPRTLCFRNVLSINKSGTYAQGDVGAWVHTFVTKYLSRCQHSPVSLSAPCPVLVQALIPPSNTYLSHILMLCPVIRKKCFPLPFSYLSPSRLLRCPQLLSILLFPWAWHGISRPFASATICNMLAHDKIVSPLCEPPRRRGGEPQYFTPADRDRLQSRVW